MSEQRDRVYSLTLGDTSTGLGLVIDTSVENPLQLRFQFRKFSDNKKHGNCGTIEVYNLSPESISLLETDFLVCTFAAGYASVAGPVLVVSGNVVECSTSKKGTDYITKISVGEAYVSVNQTKLSSVVGAGETVQNAIEAIRGSMPEIAAGAYTGTNKDKTIMFGQPLTGSPKQNLDTICDANNMEWHITNGKLNIMDAEGSVTTNQSLAPVVSEETGLIEVPFVSSARGNTLKKDKARKKGITFKSLLNAEYNPGYIVSLASATINGFYRINTSTFTGDFRGSPWYVECFCSDY